MQDEILIKFKLEQDGLDASFKEIQNNLTNKVNNLENELSSKFKEVAKQSGGALDPFLADIDEIVKDANKLKIITKVIEGNAASLDKNSKEFKALNGLLKEFNSKSLELSRAKKSFEEIGNEVEKINAKPLTFFDKMKNSLSGGQGITALVGGFVGGLASAGLSLITNGISSLANSIVETTAKYQRFEAVLTNTLGSNSSAQKAMKDIIDFASRTPFQVDELTDSFVKFANRGINLTIAEMTKLGDIAASQGKSFNQLTEAVLDAQTGEFERLKEFGIRASKEGDKVTLSFKGITKEVANNEDAIKNAILSYGELEGVAGGMEAISKTLGGSLSNLGDSLDKFFASIGSRIGVSLSGAISTLSEMVSKFSDFIAVKEDTIKVGIEASFQNKAEAESAQILLNEYESLKEKGVKATSAEKKRMTDITYTLRDSLGESVVAINKETGALEVNIAATKQAIKQKILLSNTELAKVALEFNNAKAQEQAANAELKRINDTRKSKNDALLNDEKNFSKRRSLLEQESQSDFLSLVPLRNAANEQSKILAKAQETIKKTRDELAKFGFSVGDFDFDELAKSAISSNKKSETAITKTSDEEKAKRKKQEKDFNDYVDKLEDDAAKKLFKQWEDEEKAQEQLDNYLEKSLEDNAKKQFESWENEKKNIASVGVSIGDAYKRGYQTAEEYQAELLEKQKQAVNEIIDLAKNGILLQIGLNPADVDRVKASVEKFMAVLNKKEDERKPGEAAAAAAEAAGAAYFAVSGAIFASDTKRREEELAALQVQQEEELRLAGDNEQKKDLIKQKYALKEKEIKRKQAEADKRKAILDATVNTAVAVVKTFATLGFAAGIVPAALMAALGAAQIAFISAQPIPKFEKGGAIPSSDIQGMISGKPHAAGGVLIEAEGNEFITRRSQAMKGDNLGLLEAINMSDSERDAYINRHYVMPALQAKESEAAKSYRSSIIEAENNLIARMSGHTLKSIDKRLIETNQSIKGLAKKDYTW
jgi:predicted phage tail protein